MKINFPQIIDRPYYYYSEVSDSLYAVKPIFYFISKISFESKLNFISFLWSLFKDILTVFNMIVLDCSHFHWKLSRKCSLFGTPACVEHVVPACSKNNCQYSIESGVLYTYIVMEHPPLGNTRGEGGCGELLPTWCVLAHHIWYSGYLCQVW